MVTFNGLVRGQTASTTASSCLNMGPLLSHRLSEGRRLGGLRDAQGLVGSVA